MKSIKQTSKSDLDFTLSLFCGKAGDVWRVGVWPGWLPGCLRGCFDENGEAYPVYLDFEDLERQMRASSLDYEKTESPIGGYELIATGRAATVLSVWLARSFASGKQRMIAGLESQQSSSSNRTD